MTHFQLPQSGVTQYIVRRWRPSLADGDIESALGPLRRDRDHEQLLREQTPIGTDAAPNRGLRVYRARGGMSIIATIDATPRFGDLLHVSLSYAKRDPFWDEIKAIREVFYPDFVDVMMLLPQAKDYVNLHTHTFHLWQTPERWSMT